MQTPESEITEAFLRVYFRLKRYGEEILTQLIQALQAAKTGRLLWSEDIISLNKRIADIASQERLLAQLKQQAIVDPDIFISRSNQLAEQRREAKLKNPAFCAPRTIRRSSARRNFWTFWKKGRIC